MKPGETYADWVATLRGLSRNCNFICKNEACKLSYVDEQIRDVLIKETPHADIRRQCLLDTDPSLDDVLKKATTYLQTTETDRVIKGEASQVLPEAVNKMSDNYQRKSTKPSARYKSCPSCYVKHERRDCPCKDLVCRKCNKKGHISPVCQSKNIQTVKQSTEEEQPKANFAEEAVYTAFDDSQQEYAYAVANKSLTTDTTERIGKQIWIHLKINGKDAEFQWDTGATCSIVGLAGYKELGSPPLTPVQTCLKGYGEKKLEIKGECSVDVKVGNQVEKNLRLLVVDTYNGSNLFGLDWSDRFGLSQQGLSVFKEAANSIEIAKCQADLEEKIAKLSSQFSDVFKPELGHCTKMKVQVHLKPGAKPVFFKHRDIPFSRRQAVKDELDRLVREGVLERLNYSDYAAPIVVVSKPNGKVRICGDFKALNQQISVDQHPLPKLDELMEKLQGGQYFSKVDLADAYLQLELDAEAKKLCVINTPFGLFSYNRMCFGLASSPAQFQRCMDTMTADLPGVAAYLDNLIITGKTTEEHWANLERLFSRLQEYGFRIRKEKCEFFQEAVEYLGYRIDKEGKNPSSSAIEAIEKLPVPQNLQEVKAFLGKINYYGRFICNLASKAAPLNKLTCKGVKFTWTEECHRAFTNLKSELIQTTKLTHYDENSPLILATDASQYGIGATLSVEINGVEKPIAHASKTLNENQKNYSQIEKEGLSIIFGLTKFRQYLFGRRFTLITDHEPLVAIFSPDKKIPVLTAQRLQRWALTLMAYQYNIRYKPTQHHSNADALSRLPQGPDVSFDRKEQQESEEISHFIQEELQAYPLDAKLVQQETMKDAQLQMVVEWEKNGSWPKELPTSRAELRPFWNIKESLFVYDGTLLLQRDAHVRVVVPKSLISQTLDVLHTSHWGIVRMKQLARRYAWWPNISNDIEMLVRTCSPCQQSANDPKKTYSSWPETTKPWERIHLDFAGPYKGKMWLLCIDAHSKYPYVAMLEVGSTTSTHTIEVLRHIFVTEGLPEVIVSDNGRQFVSQEFESFCCAHGIKHLSSPPFHPASNGEAERFVQSLKNSIEKTCAGGDSLKVGLQKFLATYRCMPHPVLDWKSLAEILHGRQPRNLLSLLNPVNTNNIKTSKQETNSDRYDIDSLVYVRNYSTGPKWLEGKIIAKLGKVLYNVRTDKGIWKRHINQLQPRIYVNDNIERAATHEATAPAASPDIPAEPRYPKRVNRRRPDYYNSANY